MQAKGAGLLITAGVLGLTGCATISVASTPVPTTIEQATTTSTLATTTASVVPDRASSAFAFSMRRQYHATA